MPFSRLFCAVILCSFLFSCSKPIAVTHWTAKDRASVNKGRAAFAGKKPFGYPKHKWYSKIICFDDKCRSKAAWVKKQREHRFKGFKDGGKLPPKPPIKEQGIIKDTVVIASNEPVIAQAPTLRKDSLIVLNEVLFEVNSFKLKTEIFPQLDSLVNFLQRNPATRIEISGHTDISGNEQHNLKLSENRADAVAEYVVDKGIEMSRVSFNGYGSSRPIADNKTEQGRRKNRRVEILIHSNR